MAIPFQNPVNNNNFFGVGDVVEEAISSAEQQLNIVINSSTQTSNTYGRGPSPLSLTLPSTGIWFIESSICFSSASAGNTGKKPLHYCGLGLGNNTTFPNLCKDGVSNRNTPSDIGGVGYGGHSTYPSNKSTRNINTYFKCENINGVDNVISLFSYIKIFSGDEGRSSTITLDRISTSVGTVSDINDKPNNYLRAIKISNVI